MIPSEAVKIAQASKTHFFNSPPFFPSFFSPPPSLLSLPPLSLSPLPFSLPSLSPSSYDDPNILSGQGTAALEVLEQMDHLGVEPDAMVIPVGGGGLLAGMATTIKYLNPRMEVIVSLGLTSWSCSCRSCTTI